MRLPPAFRAVALGAIATLLWFAPNLRPPAASPASSSPAPASAPVVSTIATPPPAAIASPSLPAMPALSLSSEPLPATPPPSPPELAILGAAGPLTLADIPAGPFRVSLESLPASDRTRILGKLDHLRLPISQLTTLRASEGGALYHICPPGPGFDPARGVVDAAALPEKTSDSPPPGYPPLAGPVPISTPPALSSKPGSKNILYLDFNGHTVQNTLWNRMTGGSPIYVALPYDTDGQPSTFSASEQAVIRNVWERVSEDYRPFDINVTTVEPATFTSTTGRVVITQAIDANGIYVPGGESSGGIAYVDVFGDSDYATNSSPAWVISDNVGAINASHIAEAVSHEFGHNIGLSHDGRIASGGAPAEEYYEGHGSGSTSWGPIMGASYDRNVTTFCRGEYYRANNFQDDLAIITAALSRRPDDAPDNNASAPLLPTGLTTGIIDSAQDADRYQLTTDTGLIELTITPYFNAIETRGNNLDVQAELLDASSNLVASFDPSDDAAVSISLSVAPGMYYLRVRGAGLGAPLSASPTGYTNYGSIGSYTIDNTSSTTNNPNNPQPPPVITEQPVGAAHPLGGSHTFTVTADATVTSYQWYFNGNPISGSLAKAASYTITNLTFDHAGTYRCEVRNTGGPRSTNTVSLAVYQDAPQAFTVNSAANVTFPRLVAGALDNYQWRRDDVPLSANPDPRLISSGATLRLNGTRTTDGGVYTLDASFDGQPLALGPITFVVRPPLVISVPPIITIERGQTPVVPITVSQDVVTYVYAGRPAGLGYVPATGAFFLESSGPQLGSYPITLTAIDLFGNKGVANFVLQVVARPLSVSLPSIVRAYQGADRGLPLTADATITTYQYTGLPAGLTYVPATGQIIHIGKKPAAIGDYPVSVTVTDRYGNTGATSFVFTVGPLPTTLLIAHAGVVDRDSATNLNLGGRFSFLPAATGLVTGKLTLGAVSYVLSGRLRGAPDEAPGVTLSASAQNHVPLKLDCALSLDAASGAGLLRPLTGPLVPVQTWSTPYTGKNLATAFAGKHTLTLLTDTPPASLQFPVGAGFGTLSVTPAGAASWTARLGDGTPLTGSGPLARGGELPILALVPGVGGSLHGHLALAPLTRTVDGSLTWSRNRAPVSTYAKSVLYRDGFAPLAVTPLGGAYVAPPSGTRMLGLDATAPGIQLQFLGGGLSDEQLARLALPTLSLNAKNIVLRPATATANPTALSLKFTPSTGAFSGSFVLTDPDPLKPGKNLSRNITFQGTLIEGRGLGYFLVPGIKTPGNAYPPTLSGAVILEPATTE